MSPITTLLIGVQVVAVLAGLLAFLYTRRRGGDRIGFALLVWFLTPVFIASGGLLLFVLAAAGGLGQANRNNRYYSHPYYRSTWPR